MRYEVSVPVQVYFEVEAESAKAIDAMTGQDIEDAYWQGQFGKYREVDMRTADFESLSVYDPVEE